jgi:uncharacterized membrane protein YgaE (UPF0421/DUF939 family)
VGDPWSVWRDRAITDLRQRVHGVRPDVVPALQIGVASGAAWFVASNLLHHQEPVFAPIAALIVLSAAAGKRWRRAVEMVIGVAMGIAVADLIVLGIGVGPIQIAVVVFLAIVLSFFIGGGLLFVGQAASSAIIVATIARPGGSEIYVNRVLDSLVGGMVGLLVTVVLPFNALTRVQQDAGRALELLSEALMAGAEALERSHAGRARQSLDALFGAEAEYERFRDSLALGEEQAAAAPLRWSSRSHVQRYVDAAVHIERANRNARVMQVWIVTVLRDKEPVGEAMPQSLELLAKAVATLRSELLHDTEPRKTREQICDALREIRAAYRDEVGFAGSVVLAQVRGAAVDLLIAAGLTPDEAEAAARDEKGHCGD